MATRRVTSVVLELFGKEGSLGIHVRLDNGVVIRFTEAEAETVGWRLGDRIVALDSRPINNQYELLSAISLGKNALRTNGAPMNFTIERLGAEATGPQVAL